LSLTDTERQGPQARPALASLVLGGYDRALYKPNGVDFKMRPEPENRDLSVTVRSISVGGKISPLAPLPLSKEPFLASLNTGVSHFWLPIEACHAFEDAFHLRYNATTDLYLLNDTQHSQLQTDNPTVTFNLGSDAVGGPDVAISFPYSSFELKINEEYPLIPRWSRYFPIRRALRPEQFTLGRAFFQEAYIVANYDRRNFSVAQRSFDAAKSDIIAIRDSSVKNGEEMTSVATYGLIAGGCALAGILVLLLAWRCARRSQKADPYDSASSTLGKAELDSTTRTIFELDKSAEVYEMSGKPGRVEAATDIPCAADEEEAGGPFELPANEDIQVPPTTPHDEVISPIDGTVSMGNYTTSTFGQAVSPVTPVDTMHLIREKS
jgi:hypothetical protein